MLASLLDHAPVRERVMPLSVEAFHALGEVGLLPKRAELLAGLVLLPMPISPPHSFYIDVFVTAFRASVQPGCFVRQEQPITGRDSEPQPDVAVVRGTRDDYLLAHPQTAEVIVEIAISSADVDHHKSAIYATAGVGAYWIVLPGMRRVEVQTNPLGNEYTHRVVLTRPEDVLTAGVLPGFRLTLAEVFPPQHT